jgi:hypothetical protein
MLDTQEDHLLIERIFRRRAEAESELYRIDATLNGVPSARLNLMRRMDKVLEHTTSTAREAVRLNEVIRLHIDRSLKEKDE